MCYLQDSEVLKSSKVHLGDPGDIISVQVTAIKSKVGSDFCRLHLWSIPPRLAWTGGMLLVMEKAIPMTDDIPLSRPN